MWETLSLSVIVAGIAGYYAFERWCEYKERTAEKR